MLKKALIAGLVSVMAAGIVLGVIGLASPSAVAINQGQGARQSGWTNSLKERPRGSYVEIDAVESPSDGPRRLNQEGDCGDRVEQPGAGNLTGSADFGRGGGRNGESLANQQGSGGAAGAGRGRTGNQPSPDPQTDVEDWLSYEGTVTGEDDHVTIGLDDGSTVELGMGPVFYREEIGFTVTVGDQIVVTGYYEDGEFRVGTIEQGGKTFRFRDEYGRPLWAGRGQRAA